MNEISRKDIQGLYRSPGRHWVGNGFPVRSLFAYNEHGRTLSPFLLLDYAGPTDFTPTEKMRGVGEHPHRGFETVTIVYQGEVAHRDSTGQGGVIGPGDVQWMTAGAGIVHEEFHAPAFRERGGPLEMVQLWVNLPARDKWTSPGYQAITAAEIPTVSLPDDAGQVRVIAGELDGRRGPAKTFTPMQVWDMRLAPGGVSRHSLPEGWPVALVVLKGTLQVNDSVVAREAQLVILGREHREVVIESNAEASVLLLSGEPIDEPIIGHGPFVMNTREEIMQAINDYSRGTFGQVPG